MITYKKGSTTVFLALLLSIFVSLISVSLISARMAAARTQILTAMDIGLYSLLGQYERNIRENYGLFLIDGSLGGGTLKPGHIYHYLEHYISPVLGENHQDLQIEQGGFAGYMLMTDEEGVYFYRQVVEQQKLIMQNGSEGIKHRNIGRYSTLLSVQEKKGKEWDVDRILTCYEAEIEQAEEDRRKHAASFVDYQYPEYTVINPVPILKDYRNRDLMSVLGVENPDISDWKGTLLSERSLQKGFGMDSDAGGILASNKMEFRSYLMDHISSYGQAVNGSSSYGLEYILFGRKEQTDNLKEMIERLLWTRIGMYLMEKEQMNSISGEIETLAEEIAGQYPLPPSVSVIQDALEAYIIYSAGIRDVKALLSGGFLPISGNTLPTLTDLMEGSAAISIQQYAETELWCYQDYLEGFLISCELDELLIRSMDMIEQGIRNMPGMGRFQLDSGIIGVHAFMKVHANQRKTYLVKRQYSYD